METFNLTFYLLLLATREKYISSNITEQQEERNEANITSRICQSKEWQACRTRNGRVRHSRSLRIFMEAKTASRPLKNMQ